jgi:two-component sensor histidine kinase
MDRKANQEKALAAYREKQKRVAALLSRIQDKLARHADPVVCWGHVG